jgi:site-specific recombinase XerD
MTGYELITPTPTTPNINNNGNELSTNKETDDNGYYKEYLPDNTRVRLIQVIQEMTPHLKQEQIITLAKTLSRIFNNIECTPCQRSGDPRKHNEFLINKFLSTKRIEGRSKRTLEYYEKTLRKLAKFLEQKGMLLVDMDTEDFREYLSMKMDEGCSGMTCDNIRRNASSFYRWARAEHYTTFSPIDAVAPVKRKKKVKQPFTQLQILKLREECTCTRDRAIIELLLCSGIRVGELCPINIRDMDFQNMEFKVLGKGNKERICYLNEVARTWIERYLEERRQDDNPYLWVSKQTKDKGKHIGVHGVERRIRDMGKRANIIPCTPHMFRHTFATNALNKGIPIEQVQQLLGHEKLDTTMIYAKVAREDVKFNHHKLLN